MCGIYCMKKKSTCSEEEEAGMEGDEGAGKKVHTHLLQCAGEEKKMWKSSLNLETT